MVLVNPKKLSPPRPENLNTLRVTANRILKHATISVTNFARPDIDARNYYSIGRYYHPNPETADGLPWVSRDGIANLASDYGPKATMRELARDVLQLAVAGFFIDKKYAMDATGRMTKWFLDYQNGMRPHLENAQMVPGVNTGRPAGIIDSHMWLNFVLAMDFLNATNMNNDFFDSMRKWFGQYSDWLMYSSNGIAARDIGNNISAWWATQIMAFSIFAGNRDAQIHAAVDMYKRLINERLDNKGCFFGELQRTRSLHYCLFHLNAMALIAELANGIGIDLWNWRGVAGFGIERAFDFLAPYLSGQVAWPHQQIAAEQFPTLFSFHLAARRLGRPDLDEVNKKQSRAATFGDIMGPQWIWPK